MIRRPMMFAVMALACTLLPACSDSPQTEPRQPITESFSVEEKSITELQAALTAGDINSEQLVEAYLMRIATLDRDGPRLGSVLSLNADALAIARALDSERAQNGPRGPLHGIPILLKDNIESADAMATTAGSLALQDNITKRDAALVKRLRDAGAIILGKTNLSEWANIRSAHSVSGWSAVGGQTRNPHAIDRNPCGSSSGSGVATAASFAAASIGTETDGSITCPAAVNGVVGLKPTLGLVSRRHIIPIAHSQDTAGPMTRSVSDAAILLGLMAGSDPADPATAEADQHKTDYVAALQANALHGKRLGVLRFATGYHRGLDAVFEQHLQTLRDAGAELVELTEAPNLALIGKHELRVLLTELKVDLNQYLASSPASLPVRSLSDVIAFNSEHAETEFFYFEQDLFEQAEQSQADAAYLKARAENQRLAGLLGIDKLLADHKLDALIAPTTGPAWTIDAVNGDHYLGSVSTLPAVAGYPHLTVPMGTVKGLPVAMSWIGPAWSEALLLALAYDFEQRSQARVPPTYVTSEELPELHDSRYDRQQDVITMTPMLPLD